MFYRLRYNLACWLVGFDIYAASEVAHRQGYRLGVNSNKGTK
jgi:hypothetical protein